MNVSDNHGIELGYLSGDDPLYGYLQHHIAPQLGFNSSDAVYRVKRFPNSSNVYLYEEIHRGFRLVGKFFKSYGHDHSRRTGETEFNNLLFLREVGFSEPPHYIVKPYGFNHAIDNLIVTEYIDGESLGRIIDNAIHQGRHKRLYKKLSALASFLARLHNRTAGDYTVDFDECFQYAGRLIRSLEERWGVGGDHSHELWHLRDAWRERDFMWTDRSVIVHGDATPSNLLFGHGPDVIAIDLERMKWADRAFDLGRLCGELKHFFLQGTGNPFSAEPFIGHFLWEYCGWFPERDRAFHSITMRIPFYMGITLLRIARNSWIDWEYRWRLIHEAIQILRARI